MPKSFTTQGAIVLLERPIDVEGLATSLSEFDVLRRVEGSANKWMGRPGVLLAMRPEVNGHVIVDVVDEPWPDHMGDPQDEAMLFGAWSMGWFGPFVFPDALARARGMCIAWDEAREVSARHRAFARIRSTYVLGADKDAPVLPADYASLPELELVTDVARTLLQAPGALAYFNPNGEVLRSLKGLDEELDWCRDNTVLPLPLWANVRVFQVSPTWTMMDTIGMEQLDVDDHEACFLTEKYAPGDIDNFLRGATDYIRQKGPVIADGNTMEGPGGVRWKAHVVAESLAPRPRSVLRWFPEDGSDVPRELRP